MHHKKGEQGFTLIELLVVIAIIGLLSSVILASLNNARKKGRDARRAADLKELQVALEEYYSNLTPPGYPATLATLTAGGSNAFITVLPTDPLTGQPYNYAIAPAGAPGGANSYYCIGAIMELTVPSPADTCNAGALGTTAPTGNFRVGP